MKTSVPMTHCTLYPTFQCRGHSGSGNEQGRETNQGKERTSTSIPIKECTLRKCAEDPSYFDANPIHPTAIAKVWRNKWIDFVWECDIPKIHSREV